MGRSRDAQMVQPGRLACISFGPAAGKVVVIVDIIDQNRGIVDGPLTGVNRQWVSFKRLALTRLLMKDIPRGCSTEELKQKLEESRIMERWEASEWAKRIARREKRENLTDFERHQVRVLKRQRREIIMGKCFDGIDKRKSRLRSRKPSRGKGKALPASSKVGAPQTAEGEAK